VPLTVGTRAICRFPTGPTSVFSLACRSVILAKVSESAQHSGRSAAGVTGKVRAAPPRPFRECVERTQNLGGAPGTVAGAVGELGDDAGIGEWVHVAVCVTGRYAQLALEQLRVDHGLVLPVHTTTRRNTTRRAPTGQSYGTANDIETVSGEDVSDKLAHTSNWPPTN
jgi:hypothetical protein